MYHLPSSNFNQPFLVLTTSHVIIKNPVRPHKGTRKLVFTFIYLQLFVSLNIVIKRKSQLSVTISVTTLQTYLHTRTHATISMAQGAVHSSVYITAPFVYQYHIKRHCINKQKRTLPSPKTWTNRTLSILFASQAKLTDSARLWKGILYCTIRR